MGEDRAARRAAVGLRGEFVYSDCLADIYDATYHFKNYQRDVDYLLSSIRRHHPAASSLLETAAGTGRYLELLHTHFEVVEGLDLSDAMLARAALRVPQARLHVGDMAEFDLAKTFDVVCCLFRSIAYCGSVERLRTAVASMARHLAPGGLLLIEPFFTPETYWENRVTLNEYDGEDLKIACMYVSEREGMLARLRMHYLVGTPQGVEHFEELHELGLYSPADFETAFAAAGLSLEYDPQGPSGVGLYIGRAER
jgi:SAM-dependent methyltransferase